MKHSVEERAALDAALSRIQVDCSDEQKERLLTHIDLLIEKNKTLNLTRISSFEEAIVLHIEDSLSVLREFSSGERCGIGAVRDGMVTEHSVRFCDIGTGGGFPGIPLGIVSGYQGVLLDSVQKKARAVQEFIETLSLEEQLRAEGKRSEGLAREEPGAFDLVVARAVASLNVVEELATPLLRFKGRLVAMRGIESSDDEKIALAASESLGLELVNSRKFTIGEHGEFQRSVYVFEKTGDSKVRLPRRPGMAVKRPLGL